MQTFKALLRRLLDWLRGQGRPEAAGPPPIPGYFQVTADASRCVQCGICGYNCPVGIEVREYARRGENVTDPRCISCDACIEKCPRGTLRWGPAILLREDNRLEINPDALPEMIRLTPREMK
jgi:ferredoxin